MGLRRIPHPDHDPDLPEKHPVPLRFHRQRVETTTVFDSRRLLHYHAPGDVCGKEDGAEEHEGSAGYQRVNTAHHQNQEGQVPQHTRTPNIRDTQAAALVRAPKPARTRRLAEFRAAHKDGMDALKRHDPAALEAALIQERQVIDVVSAAIQQARTRRK